jgi:hypothetical protein
MLVLATPAVAAFWWWAFNSPSTTYSTNDYMFLSGMLVAFATLYPNTEAWGWIPFKWMAFACVVCGSLMLLAQHVQLGWQALGELWVSCLVGFAYIQHTKEAEHDDYESPLIRLKRFFRKKPKLRVMPSPTASRYRDTVVNEPSSELDVLLDKIAKSGMGSLTAKERAQLERAREALLRKDQR